MKYVVITFLCLCGIGLAWETLADLYAVFGFARPHIPFAFRCFGLAGIVIALALLIRSAFEVL